MPARVAAKRQAVNVSHHSPAKRRRLDKDKISDDATSKSNAIAEAKSGLESDKKRCWIGIDGTRSGWCVALVQEGKANGGHDTNFSNKDEAHFDTLKIALFVCATIAALRQTLLQVPDNGNCGIEAIGIDMPIGLPDHAERGGRGCDRAARRILAEAKTRAVKSRGSASAPLVGPSSIFTPPSRPALEAFARGGTHAEVTATNRKSALSIDGKETDGAGLGLSIQSYNIMGKILEVDRELQSGTDKTSSQRQRSLCAELALSSQMCVPAFECHPELAFLALKARQATMEAQDDEPFASVSALYSKKTSAGRAQRVQLLQAVLGQQSKLYRMPMLSKVDAEPQDTIDWDDLISRASLPLPLLSTKVDDEAGELMRMAVATDDMLDALVCATSAMRYSKASLHVIGSCQVTNDAHGLPMVIAV